MRRSPAPSMWHIETALHGSGQMLLEKTRRPGPNLGYFIVKIGFAGMVHPRTAQILEHGGCRCSLLQFEAAKTRITKQLWQRRVIT
eukprot:s1516_g5.t1